MYINYNLIRINIVILFIIFIIGIFKCDWRVWEDECVFVWFV